MQESRVMSEIFFFLTEDFTRFSGVPNQQPVFHVKGNWPTQLQVSK